MKCRDIQKILLRDTDEELSADAQSHLAQCPACSAAMKQAKTLQGLLALKRYEKPEAAAQERCVQAVLQRLRQGESVPEKKEILWFPKTITAHRLALAAALALLLVGGWVFLITPATQAPSTILATPTTNLTTDVELPANQMLELMAPSTNVDPARIEYGTQPSRVVDFKK